MTREKKKIAYGDLQKLAKIAGVSRVTFSRWVNDESYINEDCAMAYRNYIALKTKDIKKKIKQSIN